MKFLRKALPTVLPAVLVLLFLSRCAPEGQDLQRPDGRQATRSLRVEGPLPARQPLAASDRVLLRFRSDVPEEYADGLLQSYGFAAVRKIPRLGVFSVRTSPGVGVDETLAMLRRNPDIAEARPDYRTRLAATPNDSYFSQYQYNLRNRGTILDISDDIQPQTTADADIKAATAWDITQGDPEVIIAVIDSGVDMTHPDLAAKVVSSGRDFANGDDDATDDHWHGTHTAGIAAADTNNGEGIAGVAWNCKILPVKVTEADGTGYYSWTIDAIIWATDQGADVINLSVGGDADDPFLKEACKYAFDHDVVIAAATGNEAGAVAYPAAYDDYVLAVAATDYNDEVADFSNYGPEVDVAAPGVYILGPAPQWYVGEGNLPYLFASGTSEATPHVAGMAALIRSLKPGLGASEIMKIIRYTADDVNQSTFSGRDDHIGFGRINMRRALAPYILK